MYEFSSNLEIQKYTSDKIIESLAEAKELIKKVLFKNLVVQNTIINSSTKPALSADRLVEVQFSIENYLTVGSN